MLGISDPRTDRRIDFVGGIRGLGELERKVDSGEWAVAFALHPTSIDQLFAVADAGLSGDVGELSFSVTAVELIRLAGAGLDVFADEPNVPRALLAMDNVVLQPHVSWLTQETLGRSLAVAMENCRRLRDAEALLHRVA